MTASTRRRVGITVALVFANITLAVSARNAWAGDDAKHLCSTCVDGAGHEYDCCRNLNCPDPLPQGESCCTTSGDDCGGIT